MGKIVIGAKYSGRYRKKDITVTKLFIISPMAIPGLFPNCTSLYSIY